MNRSCFNSKSTRPVACKSLSYNRKAKTLLANIFQILTLLSLAIIFACSKGNPSNENSSTESIIGKKEIQLSTDVLVPEVLWAFGRVGSVSVSPDNDQLVYTITWYDYEKNKGNTELYLSDIDGNNPRQLTKTASGEYNPIWMDAQNIAFLSNQSGEAQIWFMNIESGKKEQISQIDGGIQGFKFSSDFTKVLYAKSVKLDQSVQDQFPDLPKAKAYIETDLMYRHWDQWHDYTYNHIFAADFNGKVISNSVDIMDGQAFDSPMKPMGGMEQINFSPDGKFIAYTCKPLRGKAYSLSTNSDIFLYEIATAKVINFTEGMPGYDLNPVFSPDGKYLAWESMARDGYEADQNRLFIGSLADGSRMDYSANFDYNVHGLSWSEDGNKIWFTSDYHARYQIFELNIADTSIRQITEGDHNYLSVAQAGNQLIGTKQSMSMPTEIFSINPATGTETQLSYVNQDLLDQLTLAHAEERWIKTTDNKEMLVWVIYPPHFDATKKYPALLYCQGGPQSSVSQFFSYRWNFQMMAANGYIVVAPNRRGLPSFGQEWNEQISGDYGGQNMRDYLSAIDALAAEPFVDENRLGAVGASYGGFSVFWLAGNHEGRFKAFIAHDGMFNLEAQYLETEEMFFVNWDLGGPFWDKSNEIAQRSYANSPHRFVDKWDTPILVIHGEQDFRITYTQSMSAFNAAVLRGIPAKYLHFPDENHWVLQPQNSILWQRVFRDWLNEHLMNEQ